MAAMADSDKSEAQAHDAVLRNRALNFSNINIGDEKPCTGYSIDDGLPLQRWGFPGANDVWASRDSEPSARPVSPMDIRSFTNPIYEHKHGHAIANYLNGTKVDDYYDLDGHTRTVHRADRSWSRTEADWKHGTILYEQHDDSGVRKRFESVHKCYESLRDPHGKLIYKMRQDKDTGDSTLTERGSKGRLFTKHYRLS
jgi:hypothetical protein